MWAAALRGHRLVHTASRPWYPVGCFHLDHHLWSAVHSGLPCYLIDGTQTCALTHSTTVVPSTCHHYLPPLPLQHLLLTVLLRAACVLQESRNSGADEQGLVQGALFGAQSLAQAVGGITFSTLYAAIPEQGGAIAYGVAAIVQVIAVVAACMLPTGK
jgi:hypothetical protein